MVSPLVLLGSPLSQKYLELSNISPVKNNFFQRGAIALIENLRIVLFSLEASFLLGVRGTNNSACIVLWGHYAYIYIQTKYFPGHSSATLRGVLVGRASV